MATPLIASDDHLAHDGLVELVAGQPVPCYESPERATAIREALLATRIDDGVGGYRLPSGVTTRRGTCAVACWFSAPRFWLP